MAIVLSRRAPFFLIAAFCAGLLGCGFYLQFQSGLEPCPLCVFQRLCFMAIGVLALLAGAHGARLRGATVYCVLLFVAAAIGAGIAGRQVWLQHLPADQVPECGPGLDFLMEMYPLTETIRTVLRGSGDCAKVDWTLLGLSIAEWSLISFIGLCFAAGAIAYLRMTQRSYRVRRRSAHY
jgi:protein dithiol:quinone oxidoreductase